MQTQRTAGTAPPLVSDAPLSDPHEAVLKKSEESAPPGGSDPLWYKDAVIYQVHIKSFFDGNNDGVGDFAGLIAKLDYIVTLGVNTVWLLPFYPSPRRDDGYDIAEYKGVHADYGGMADARRFVLEAHKRGLRVITELVINHTSDQHRWFQRARQARAGSAARNFYVWSDNDEAYAGTRIIFLDTEKSNWTWDQQAKAYFWHRFYSHQPDLNFDNPAVLKAVLDVMSFWLKLGIDGLRLDAVPYLIEREGSSNENLPETHAILKQMRAYLDQHFPGRMLLAEANMWPEDVLQYFGNDDECHMAFHFPLMPRMYMALAQEDRFPIVDILRQTPEIPADCQWAIFLRNHDELTLEMVTDRERDYLWNHYAPDRRARLNMGIRRRLAPLLERDRRRIELLNSMLMSMPGTPVIYYGDEIGMGDNIHLGDRDGVRTPMQWSPDRNAGFSRSDPAAMVLPPIMDPLYGYQAINVEAQSEDPYSLLNWMRRLLEVRARHRAFGRGSLTLLYPGNRKILAYLRQYGSGTESEETILCVANVSRASQAVELDLSAFDGRVPVEMLGGTRFPVIGKLSYLLTLPPFGFYWFVLAERSRLPAGQTPAPEVMPEFATLVLRNGLADLLRGPAHTMLARDILPAYLLKRRWYAAKQHALPAVRVVTTTVLPIEAGTAADGSVQPPMLLAELETGTEAGSARYLLPLGFAADGESDASLPQQLALARVRRGRRVGILTDAYALGAFALRILELIRTNATIKSEDGEARCRALCTPDDLNQNSGVVLRRIAEEQSNSSLIIGEQIVLKVLRRLEIGIHPEVEMGRCLVERGYANTPPMLGDVTRYGADGTSCTLIVLQRFVHNQGDGWRWTLDTLERAIQDADAPPQEGVGVLRTLVDPMEQLRHFGTVLGQRLAQLHAVLAQPSDDPAFAPERLDRKGASAVVTAVRQQLQRAFEVVKGLAAADGEFQEVARQLAAARAAFEARLHALGAALQGSLRIRIHGDFHLGQVLVSSGDAWIVDFEGEPARPLDQRRAKASPWRDVAGLLRSIDYAAAFADEKGPGSVGPGDLGEAAIERKAMLIARYRSQAREAVLQGYRAEAPDPGGDQGERLLELFSIEKAAYEVCYEAANRPEWIGIPLRGLLTLARQLSAGMAANTAGSTAERLAGGPDGE